MQAEISVFLLMLPTERIEDPVVSEPRYIYNWFARKEQGKHFSVLCILSVAAILLVNVSHGCMFTSDSVP